MQQIEQVEYGH